ncbi:MAG: DUF1572 family protein [Bryobacterales bacterium]|nr:DUF1572 family protein [Bryobacterales bacterium]
MDCGSAFLEFSTRKLRQLQQRIGECLDRLSEEQIWARGHEQENAVGNLVLHLSGNVRQWVTAAIGGKPDIRVRDREFSARGGISTADLKARLDAVVSEAAGVMEGLSPDRLLDTITPQGYQVTVLEGIYHVVEHFSLHTGQIMFATKMLTGQDLGFYRHLARESAHSEKTP